MVHTRILFKSRPHQFGRKLQMHNSNSNYKEDKIGPLVPKIHHFIADQEDNPSDRLNLVMI